MFPELQNRSQKAGQPPGTLVYTGTKKNTISHLTITIYSADNFYEKSGLNLEECLPKETQASEITWLHLTGLNNIPLVEEIAKRYNLHPLTVEDILNVEQRSKVEEFDDYLFTTLKILHWNAQKKIFTIQQLCLVIADHSVLSFQDHGSTLFNNLRERMRNTPHAGLRKQSSDYLAYRLIDTVVDQYFVILEGLGEQIEKVEDLIITSPTKQSMRALYRLRRQMLLLRKAIWPIREVISHLLKVDGKLISSFTQVYLRDVYDHTVQAIDNVETFRDMLSNMLDIYLSSLTNRMNEIMKVLTIITTIFIPITFIASIYGMNFIHMPELKWKWAYPAVLGLMACVTGGMLYFFRRKKWI